MYKKWLSFMVAIIFTVVMVEPTSADSSTEAITGEWIRHIDGGTHIEYKYLYGGIEFEVKKMESSNTNLYLQLLGSTRDDFHQQKIEVGERYVVEYMKYLKNNVEGVNPVTFKILYNGDEYNAFEIETDYTLEYVGGKLVTVVPDRPSYGGTLDLDFKTTANGVEFKNKGTGTILLGVINRNDLVYEIVVNSNELYTLTHEEVAKKLPKGTYKLNYVFQNGRGQDKVYTVEYTKKNNNGSKELSIGETNLTNKGVYTHTVKSRSGTPLLGKFVRVIKVNGNIALKEPVVDPTITQSNTLMKTGKDGKLPDGIYVVDIQYTNTVSKKVYKQRDMYRLKGGAVTKESNVKLPLLRELEIIKPKWVSQPALSQLSTKTLTNTGLIIDGSVLTTKEYKKGSIPLGAIILLGATYGVYINGTKNHVH